ncbi:MAG TPA: DUF5666 domain-containing protein [Burkholderiaceae bacterium]|nr:DUF5666 domain-containing protein [Burkholderiaceae bacterium]
MKQLLATFFVAFAIAAGITSCGGGTDGTGAVPPPPANMTSSGVMTKGSVILNGIHFDPAAALIVDDRGRSAAQLDTGMVVKLRGRSDDGVTGTADRIDVENDVRGTIQSIDALSDPKRFTVAGLVVVVDDLTVFANVSGFAALTAGTRVEVHGLRDSGGLLHASRIEVVGAQDGPDEVRGVVGNLLADVDQFTLNGTITVNYAGAAFTPAGASEASLAAGIFVEVRGTLNGSVFTATQVEVEDLKDIPFRGDPGEQQEVEGFISGFTVHPGEFQVNGRTVRTTDATVFEGGAAADLANDVAVEVDGVLDAQRVLVATRIEFQRMRILLQGLATAVDVPARTVAVLGQEIHADDLTRIHARPNGGGGNSSSLADITANVDCVDVRGHMDGTVVVAERIMELSQCNQPDEIQANVTAENEAGATLTFFDSLIASLPVSASFEDGNENSITRAAFFALVHPAGPNSHGTLVRLRGASAAGMFVTEQAQVKN